MKNPVKLKISEILKKKRRLEIVFGKEEYGARQIVKALWGRCKEPGSLVPRKEIGIPCMGISDVKWSMEQLWLAFVMKGKYNKTWNGKEWEERVNHHSRT